MVSFFDPNVGTAVLRHELKNVLNGISTKTDSPLEMEGDNSILMTTLSWPEISPKWDDLIFPIME